MDPSNMKAKLLLAQVSRATIRARYESGQPVVSLARQQYLDVLAPNLATGAP